MCSKFYESKTPTDLTLPSDVRVLRDYTGIFLVLVDQTKIENGTCSGKLPVPVMKQRLGSVQLTTVN